MISYLVQHRKIRNKCNKRILNAKQSYFDKISEKINTETNGSKNWWNLVRSLLHSDSGGDRFFVVIQGGLSFFTVMYLFGIVLFAASKIVFATSVLYTEVGPPLLNQVRYHLPITGVLNHPTIVMN
jgi:hypothetical protein